MMVGTVLLGGVMAGLDNLEVCAGVGLLPMRPLRRLQLAGAFTACETIAPVLGVILGQAILSQLRPVARIAEPVMTIVCAAVVVVLALTRTPDDDESESRPLFGLPLALSFDNLAAGVGLSPFASPAWLAALLLGFVSASMSCLGLYGGSWVRRRFTRFLPARVEWIVGGYLGILAIRMVVGGT